ncbi:MAG: hypothetical protein KAW94_04770 [Candidatus Thorarchaeota archaeon]|nr:hypothetical protein [Candidatus Thorarchaeota archaeon]
MVKEIIILREGGILIFHYSVTGTKKLDELVAAFLSAVGTFAEEVGQDQIRVMSFSSNKLVWERKGDLYFIALVAEEDSGEIHRVILKDIAEQFVSLFYTELLKELPNSRVFRPFADIVEAILQKFDGVPGLARRYRTALLPADDIRSLKATLSEIELNRDILRGSMITWDGYVVVSNLRAYELEAALDFTPPFASSESSETVKMIEHSCLDPSNSFMLVRVRNKGVCAFVIALGLSEKTYVELVSPFVTRMQMTSFFDIKKFDPERMEKPIVFYEHDAVIPALPLEKVKHDSVIVFANLSDEMREGGHNIVNALGNNKTIADIQESSGLEREQTNEILAQLIAKGLVRITKIFPAMDERDDRFSAYLEVIGIKKRDFDVVDVVWRHCTGSLSLQEISERTQIPASRILEVLRALGNHVTWEKERIMNHVR